jgi:chromosome segregation ATPase
MFDRSTPERTPEHQMSDTWLTYTQAGERFGLTPNAMRMRAKRLGWRTQPDNHGRTLILVPADAEIEPRRSREGSPERAASVSVEQTEQFGRMLDLFEAADARADRAERRAEQAEQRAERAEHGIEQAEQRAKQAEERRTAAQALADHALAEATDATARADRLRDNLNSTYADLMTAERRAKGAEDRAKQAHAEAQAALRATEALRQADAARRAKGLLARLRAAWRGE